jgi:class 3 adenylate cyclase
VLAHSEEQSLRARFKTNHATKETKDRVETILKTMMPPDVLVEVQGSPGGSLPHHQYEMATIAQSDLCGFTKIASQLEPVQVVQFIGELFGKFDELTDKYGIYKVETVGDAYIGGQAEYPLTKINSPTSVIQFGIDMIKEVLDWSKRLPAHLGVDVVRCRVGVHHGSCIGGVVDKEMQRYHIFGELMKVIEVLESTAPQGELQISAACHEALLRERKENGQVENPELKFQERESDNLVAAKGQVHTYAETGGRTFLLQGLGLSGTATRRVYLNTGTTSSF